MKLWTLYSGRETLLNYLQWHRYIMHAMLIRDAVIFSLFYKQRCILLMFFLKSVQSRFSNLWMGFGHNSPICHQNKTKQPAADTSMDYRPRRDFQERKHWSSLFSFLQYLN